MPLDSRIEVFLNKRSYDALLIRHGQYVYWKSSTPCPCVSQRSESSPNPNCRVCYGRGYIFGDDTEFTIRNEKATMIENNSINVIYNDVIELVSSNLPSDYSVLQYSGNKIIFNKSIPTGFTPIVTYRYTNKTSRTLTGAYVGNGMIEFDLFVTSERSGLKSPVEIVNVQSIRHTQNNNIRIEVIDTYRNFVRIYSSNSFDIGDTFDATVEYLNPHTFQINGITEKMRYANSFILPSAEAMLTYPEHFDISENDVFTLSFAEMVGFTVIEPHNEYFELDQYDVVSIISITSDNVSYTNGTDYMLIGRDTIRFINTDMISKTLSIRYNYRISFKALTQLPMIRTGENQLFPKKINLMSYKKVNRQDKRDV